MIAEIDKANNNSKKFFIFVIKFYFIMQNKLKRYIYLSIGAAISTILLKLYAFYITGSVGFYSDALESIVNLIGAIVALIMLIISAKPADKSHNFGHTKAEYFSSTIEGALIIIAAVSIIWSAILRLIHPKPLDNLNVGILFSVGASIINLVVAIILIRNGKKHHSIAIEADGKHLMTDVITSAGVIIAIIIVKYTNIYILDPIIAILVAINIIYTGYQLINKSVSGLMDASIPDTDLARVSAYLDSFKDRNISYHSLMTRKAGQRIFISLHLLVPNFWTIKEAHDFAEELEQNIEKMFDTPVNVTTHIEPNDDPISFNDIKIDRKVKK
ncbi:MAG TPA: cation diffusion facilitator family transporter [Bacteroidales bacterium]|nr:cation diffusion facilitator family transporter [Bacteroidales bacterium]